MIFTEKLDTSPLSPKVIESMAIINCELVICKLLDALLLTDLSFREEKNGQENAGHSRHI